MARRYAESLSFGALSFGGSGHIQGQQLVPIRTGSVSQKLELLHGNLVILVKEAKNLPNMDAFHKTLGDIVARLPGTGNNKITSDPYVTVSVAGAVVGRTFVISNSENPVWEQHFDVPVAHYASEVQFVVKDSDVVGSQLIGVVAIPVERVYSGIKVEGTFPILGSNGKPCKPGAVLTLSIQYVPIEKLTFYDNGVGSAKTFDSRGYVNFRNLAKMSRPNQKKRRVTEEDNGGEGRKRNRKGEFSVLEVVDEEEEEEEDLKGLLGDEFQGRKRWRGSTRLLLLDERYGDKGVEELPQAIQAVMKENASKSMGPAIELVRCRLTLLYDYWQMNEILEALLPEGMIAPSAFETVGHIAHLNLRDEHLPYRKFIAKVILDKNKPKIQTVVNKIDAIQNDYRTMQLEVLAGNHSLVTKVVENGLRFQVDLATVYWNSRLATERQRLLNSFTRNDVVCDVFSGVGPIAISAAKIVKRVYANDLNPHAVEYLQRNSGINKLDRKIKVFNMDGRRFISAMFASDKAKSITQVVMNLPKDAAEYLDAFRGILRDRSKDEEFSLPMIHVYGFSKAEDPEFDFHQRIRIALSEVAVDVEMRRVRLVAPGKWMLCASFILPKSVAFSKPVDV